MDYFTTKYLIWAVVLGAISAVSLPLGAIIGLQTKPRPIYISVLAAFGAGALIAALTVELVAPTLFELEEYAGSSDQSNPYTNFYALITGAVIGGVLFVLLDQLVNAKGGFLRRTSSSIAYFTAQKHNRQRKLLQDLSHFPLLKDLSPEHINSLVSLIRPVKFSANEVIARQGDDGVELVFITNGTVDAVAKSGLKTEFGAGNVVGIIPIIMGVPHPGTLTARDEVTGYLLSRIDAEQLRSLAPEFDQAARELTTRQLEYLEKLIAARDQ